MHPEGAGRHLAEIVGELPHGVGRAARRWSRRRGREAGGDAVQRLLDVRQGGSALAAFAAASAAAFAVAASAAVARPPELAACHRRAAGRAHVLELGARALGPR